MRLLTGFLALLHRDRVASALAPTFARVRSLDPNEAYLRLEAALGSVALLQTLQASAWRALEETKPDLTDAARVAWLDKRLARSKRFQPARVRSSDEGAWLAWTLRIDRAAGAASGEAADLLDTPEGRRLEALGAELAGQHLGRELMR